MQALKAMGLLADMQSCDLHIQVIVLQDACLKIDF